MSALHSAKILPILESLSNATSTLLEPIRIADRDRLCLDIDDNLKQFRAWVTAVNEQGETHVFGQSHAADQFWDKIPEYEKDKDRAATYWLAATDNTMLVIYHNWPQDQIIWKSEDAKAVFQYLLKRFQMQQRALQLAASFKVSGEAPEMPADFIEHPDYPLSKSQKTGMMFSLENEGNGLFMDPGTGKTATSVGIMCLESARCRAGKYPNGKGELKPRMYKVLIIVPKQVRLNWEREIEKFAVVPGKVTALRGGEYRRTRCLIDGLTNEDDCAFGAIIASYDSVSRTEGLLRVNWDRIIIDESHYIKAYRSLRATSLRALLDCSQRRLELTGTPIANTVFDLYSQFEFMGEGFSGFLKRENFRTFYGKFEPAGHGVERLVALQNMPLIKERIARLAFTITKKEAGLDLPEKVYDIYEVEMTAKQRKLYLDVQKQLAVEIEELLKDKNKRITADHILTKMLRLSQITSGHIVWDAEFDEEGELTSAKAVEQINAENPKVEAVIELLNAEERDPKGKTIIWAVWREDIRILNAALTKANIQHVLYWGGMADKDRQEAVDRFNNDDTCRVFIGTPACGGAGLNLLGYEPMKYPELSKNEEGFDASGIMHTDHVIFFSQNWSSTQRSQAEDRAHRRGTIGQVRVTDLTVVGTIDEEIRKRVVGKQQMAREIQDIQALLQAIVNTEATLDDE